MSVHEFIYTVLLKPAPLRAAANAVLRGIMRRRVRVMGAWGCLNPRDPVVSGAPNLGCYENDEIRCFSRLFRSGMVFVDVGANIGLYTALAIHGGASRVLAVEPHPDALCFLQRTIDANTPRCPVSIARRAAGSSTGTLTLHTNLENGGDNRLYPDPMLQGSVSVAVETLDDLCKHHGISRMDFLKCDVQGAEALVLEGAQTTLERSPDCIIMTEFWAQGLRRCGGDPLEYLRRLAHPNRTLFVIDGTRLEPVSPARLIEETSGRQYVNLIAASQRMGVSGS